MALPKYSFIIFIVSLFLMLITSCEERSEDEIKPEFVKLEEYIQLGNDNRNLSTPLCSIDCSDEASISDTSLKPTWVNVSGSIKTRVRSITDSPNLIEKRITNLGNFKNNIIEVSFLSFTNNIPDQFTLNKEKSDFENPKPLQTISETVSCENGSPTNQNVNPSEKILITIRILNDEEVVFDGQAISNQDITVFKTQGGVIAFEFVNLEFNESHRCQERVANFSGRFLFNQ